MLVFYILLACLILWGIRFAPRGSFYADCLSKDATLPIKGVFILWVFLCHAMGYLMESGCEFQSIGDRLYWGLCAAPRQLVVVMFLFYSGYGVMENVRTRGRTYVSVMPRRRILKTLLNFDVAVILFALLDLLIGRPIGFRQFLLSLPGWESVGNSNWYIFTILVCYSCAFIAFRAIRNLKFAAFFLLVLLGLFAVGMSFVKETWWYDTVLAFSAGVFVSLGRDRILAFVERRYFLMLTTCGLAVVTLHALPIAAMGAVANVEAVLFAMLVMMLTMKIRTGNRILGWCGKSLFFIYIYQRLVMLPMAFLAPDFVRAYPAAFVLIGLMGTVVFVAAYRSVVTRCCRTARICGSNAIGGVI